MSYVTNVLVSVGVSERAESVWRLCAVGDYAKNGNQAVRPLTWIDAPYEVSDGWGGSKVPECRLYGAAFNYLDWNAFLAHVESCEWESPDEVQVLVMGQQESLWAVWQFEEGFLRCVLPIGPNYEGPI